MPLIKGTGVAVLSLNKRARNPEGAIASITEFGFLALLMTTIEPHGLTGGETILVSGNTEASYNILFAGIEAPDSPTTIVLTTGEAYVGDGTGGTWRLIG